MRLFKLIHILVLITLLLISCKKENESIKELHPVNYVFINDGDTIISTVTLYCTTVYPNENKTSWVTKSKWRPAIWGTEENELHDYDSIHVAPDLDAYNGCYYNFTVTIWKFDSLNIERPIDYYKIDTLRKADDYTVTFIWPSDTINYVRLE